MTFTTLGEFNVTSLDGFFLYVAEVTPIFAPLLLFAVFIITALGTYNVEKLMGRENFLSSLAVAGYFTSIVSFLMSFIPGFIPPYMILICVTLSILFTILMLVSRD